ncbi:MAG TPA: hypothetical protein VKU85_03215, partial [bacterium]|nr:hypothetical protein [bacterium]
PVTVGAYLRPGPRHAAVTRALAAVRHLPLPGGRHAAWALAEVEAANGRDAEAERVLAERRFADEAGSRFLRVLLTEDARERVGRADAALRADPDSRMLRALAQAVRGSAGVAP